MVVEKARGAQTATFVVLVLPSPEVLSESLSKHKSRQVSTFELLHSPFLPFPFRVYRWVKQICFPKKQTWPRARERDDN